MAEVQRHLAVVAPLDVALHWLAVSAAASADWHFGSRHLFPKQCDDYEERSGGVIIEVT